MRIKRQSEIGVPKVIQIGDITFDQHWYKPSVARVSLFMNDLKSIPDFSKYKFISYFKTHLSSSGFFYFI